MKGDQFVKIWQLLILDNTESLEIRCKSRICLA